MSELELAMVTLVIPDYDQAIDHYCGELGFTLVEDRQLAPDKRWVVVAPGPGARLLLALANGSEQAAAIGKQTGGRVGFFLHTTDFETTIRSLSGARVTFLESPRDEHYGRVVVFADRNGNRWDLIEPR